MIKNRLYGALVVLLALLTVRCASDLPVPQELPASRTTTVSVHQVPGLLEAIAPYVNPAFLDRGNISTAHQGETYFGMSIDFDKIMERMDSLGFTNYALFLDDEDQDPTTFTNLVVGRDTDGQFRTPLLIRYAMSPAFGAQYLQTGSLEGFEGTIHKAQLTPLQGSQQQSSRSGGTSEEPDDYGSDRDQPNTSCPQDATVTSGGGSTSTSSSGALQEVCDVYVVTVYSTDGHGTRYVWDKYLVYENCRTVAANSSADGTGCERTEGEIPINDQNDDDDPDRPVNDSIRGVNIMVGDPCLKKQISEIIANKQGHTQLTQDLQEALDLLGEGEFNIEILEDQGFAGTDTDAETNPVSAYTVRIFLNPDLGNSALEYISSTLYHELIHARFDFYEMMRDQHDPSFMNSDLEKIDLYVSQGMERNDAHHLLMEELYMDYLRNAVLQAHPTLRIPNLEILTLAGIVPLTPSQRATARAYRIGNSGTNCN